MKTRVADRLHGFDSSDFREVFLRKQRMVDAIDFSVGVPEDHTPLHIKNAGIEAIKSDKTRYTPAAGLQELREALAHKLLNLNNISLSAEDITVVPGLTTGLLLVYMAILNPGDEIVVMDPCYPPYKHLATAIGAEVMSILTLPTFQPDLATIEASITDRTKAIVINSPNNPTGAVYSEHDLRAIADLARKHNIFVISDEIYEHFIYTGKHFSIGSVYENTITMNGFSKEYAMTGWRLGYISGPSDVIDAINELQQYVVFSSSSIAQHAAITALKEPMRFVDKYRKKRDLVVSELSALGYEVHGAQGSYYLFLRAPHDMIDLDFIEKAETYGLIFVPGRAFSSRHGYFRLSYGLSHDHLIEGVKRIKKMHNDSAIIGL